MAKLLKLRRGTTSQHGSFTGAEGEVTVDTDKETLVVHDGSTAGGHPVAAEDMANVSSTNILSRINTGAIAGTKLENSGVTAGSYGSSSAIPIVTVDAQGLVTAASTTAIDSTTIANGSASVAVASNGPITSNANHDFSAGIDVTGNITVSGTVDGVDVATRDTLFGGLTSSSGVLSNGVTATTQAVSDDSTKVATTAYVQDAITEYVFPSGTKMLFQQTAAPTGWTKITSGVDNKALRVVSGTAGSGGTNAFSNTLADRSITANSANATQGGNISVANATQGGNISVANTTAGGNVSISSVSTSGNVNSHTLSTNEIPSHSHQTYLGPTSTPNISGNQVGANLLQTGQGQNRLGPFYSATIQSFPIQSGGNGGGHSHGFSGSSHSHNGTLSGTAHNHNATFSGSEHNHTATFSGSAHNHSITVTNLDMAVSYLDVIVASKD